MVNFRVNGGLTSNGNGGFKLLGLTGGKVEPDLIPVRMLSFGIYLRKNIQVSLFAEGCFTSFDNVGLLLFKSAGSFS